MIRVENLIKWYGPTLAVNNISFDIPSGQVVGFLGPNGAGKSTTLRILTGYIPPTSGKASIEGFDSFLQADQARARLGYLPESNPLYPEMRVEEFLHYRGKLYGMNRETRNKRIDVVCDKCGLAAIRRRLIGQLSRGNKQRVGVAHALLHDPPVLILDEPTAGLDPNQITHFRSLLAELRGQHTILLSTHILSEIEKTADQVIIIAGGRIVAQGTTAQLRNQVAGRSRVVVEVKASAEAVKRALSQVEGVESVEAAMQGPWCRAAVLPRDGREVREGLGQAMSQNGWAIREMRPEHGSLEEFFVRITAQQAQGTETEPAAA